VSDDQRVIRQVSLLPVRSKPEALPEQPSQLLKPGGILVFEHLMNESGSERAAAWLPKPNGLFEVFGCLRILRYEDTRAQADWSWRPERIARLVAQK
jgi:hypothetical protein